MGCPWDRGPEDPIRKEGWLSLCDRAEIGALSDPLVRAALVVWHVAGKLARIRYSTTEKYNGFPAGPVLADSS